MQKFIMRLLLLLNIFTIHMSFASQDLTQEYDQFDSPPQQHRSISRRKQSQKKCGVLNEALATAIETGNLLDVKKYLKKDDIHQPLNLGLDALKIAAQAGHTEIVEYLLKHGANINDNEKATYTPLQFATLGKHSETIRLLIGNNANANITKATVPEPLLQACLQNYTPGVRLLLAEPQALNHIQEEAWNLLLATSKTSQEVKNLLTDKRQGKVANLFAAIERNSLQETKIAAEVLQDDYIYNPELKTPLHVALEKHLTVQKPYATPGEIENAKIVRLFISPRAMYMRDSKGQTPLDFLNQHRKKLCALLPLIPNYHKALTSLISQETQFPEEIINNIVIPYWQPSLDEFETFNPPDISDEKLQELLSKKTPKFLNKRKTTHTGTEKNPRPTKRIFLEKKKPD